jgi:cytochrome bd ubiquinol oxidase subunit II
MDLPTLWFFIVAAFFVGYFVLDGFDFGVGMSLPFLGRDDTDRRVLINTIGPVWDLNETWVIVAGAAMFAAFPEWYATLFSGFYLPLLAILLALIARGVSFEYRHQRPEAAWRRRFDRMITWGSALPAFLWGVAFANIVQGVPLDADHDFTGSFLTLLNPYALLGGVTTLLLFFTHGVVFVALKTDGDIRMRARRLATRAGVLTVVVAASFLLWTCIAHGTASGTALAAAAVMPASNDPANSLTIANASSSEYTLSIMSWVALVFLPLILGYQAWTYWVFRKRVTRAHIDPAEGGELVEGAQPESAH